MTDPRPTVRCKLFGGLATGAVDGDLELTVDPGTTVGQLLQDLGDGYPSIGEQLFDIDSGRLRSSIIVTLNGRHVEYLDGQSTEVTDGDVVRVAPPVSGGSYGSTAGGDSTRSSGTVPSGVQPRRS